MNKSKKRQRLSEEGVLRVVRAIQASDQLKVLTWKSVQGLASEHAGSGYVWTRQALERHPLIKSAYTAHEATRKKLAKSGGRSVRRLSEPQRIARLEQENDALRKQLHRYDELFATYIGNAVSNGLTVEQLSRPLERPSRGMGNSDKG
jgi:hypothetical protein